MQALLLNLERENASIKLWKKLQVEQKVELRGQKN